MAAFTGGSAWAMARDICDGHVLVTDRVVRRLSRPELEKLTFEISRRMRDLRGETLDLEDVQALRRRNQQLSRLTAAVRVIEGQRRGRRR